MYDIFLVKILIFIMVSGDFAIAQKNNPRESFHKIPGAFS